MADDSGFGQQDPNDSVGDFNPHAFVIAQLISRISTMKIVKVKVVDTAAKTVDVQPMVNQLDGNSRSTPHGVILGIPYWQWQFGKNAIVADPVVDDIGIMVCSDRDISSVVAAKAIANPGSDRQLDAADGIYIGGILNGDPEQTIKFTDTGMELHDKNSNSLVSGLSGWVFTGQVQFNGLTVMESGMQLSGSITNVGGSRFSGNFDTSGEVIAGTIGLKSHKHTGVTTGGGTSGGPTP
jgi:hypothetical protein